MSKHLEFLTSVPHLPTWGCKVWWRALQSCWECYWPCYTPIQYQYQTSIIQQPTCCYTPTWWPNLPKSIGGRKSGFFSNLRQEIGGRSGMEGLTTMLGVLLTLLYTHTMPNIYYCSTCMRLYPHLMAKLVWKPEEIWDLRHETSQHECLNICWECSSL